MGKHRREDPYRRQGRDYRVKLARQLKDGPGMTWHHVIPVERCRESKLSHPDFEGNLLRVPKWLHDELHKRLLGIHTPGELLDQMMAARTRLQFFEAGDKQPHLRERAFYMFLGYLVAETQEGAVQVILEQLWDRIPADIRAKIIPRQMPKPPRYAPDWIKNGVWTPHPLTRLFVAEQTETGELRWQFTVHPLKKREPIKPGQTFLKAFVITRVKKPDRKGWQQVTLTLPASQPTQQSKTVKTSS